MLGVFNDSQVEVLKGKVPIKLPSLPKKNDSIQLIKFKWNSHWVNGMMVEIKISWNKDKKYSYVSLSNYVSLGNLF